ncbi:MAG: chemotaxis protein CheB [Candidatus Pelagadaptatus aseana]|uniref:chemotaxis protein CheB n=1 Tax=Candidatus Pelagadaptatus aseana TaxID=3120508 RepID=UPI0039B14A8C
MSHPLQLGLLVESEHQAQVLRSLVDDSGHHLQDCHLATEAIANPGLLEATAADVWLVNVAIAEPHNRDLEDWLLTLDQPVIVSELHESLTGEEQALWLRRIQEKLHQLQGSINLGKHPEGAAPFIWVLGASTGGPEAVKEFFKALPAELGVGFIYVQHIDPGYEQTLVDIVNKHGHYPAYPVTHGDVLPPNKTAIIANNDWVELLENGTLCLKQGGWPGAYSPSIDQVFANVARSYGGRCGAIVFSGMADDGASGIRMIHQQGGEVWVQSPATCTISSMPDAALDTGVVKVIASPQGLAARLTEFMRERELTT